MRALLIVLCLLLIAGKCKKEPRPISTWLMNPDVKAYMYFKTGTWWKYADTATGETRFVEVLEDTIGIFNTTDPRSNYLSHRAERFYWKTADAIYSGGQMQPEGTGSKEPEARAYKGNVQTGTNTFFFYPFKDYELNQGLSVLSKFGEYDSLDVLGIWYQDVVAFRQTLDVSEGGRETITYVAKNYGIVRLDILFEESGGMPEHWQSFLLWHFKIIQ